MKLPEDRAQRETRSSDEEYISNLSLLLVYIHI